MHKYKDLNHNGLIKNNFIIKYYYVKFGVMISSILFLHLYKFKFQKKNHRKLSLSFTLRHSRLLRPCQLYDMLTFHTPRIHTP